MSTRTRFAPSPTGYLHIGGARTALSCWLEARRQQGEFILRIEDTDRERSTEEAVETILEGMRWLELDWDEGPFYQTQRMERYYQVIEQLLENNHAYYCFCSKDELDAQRESMMKAGLKPKYNGKCRHLNRLPEEGESAVIRFRNPDSGTVLVDDMVRGRIVFDNQELDDLIIARSDGSPTYNLTVVVDDLDMGITEVIRGEDHLNNTPRQINIYRALEATPPRFAHVSMIHGADGSKLSKRHGAVSVLQYRDEGYYPEALLNYLARLGWSHGDREMFTRDDLLELFSIEDVSKSASVFNPEKLLWLNHQYLMNTEPEKLAPHFEYHLMNSGLDVKAGPPAAAVIPVYAERCKTFVEMVEAAEYLYRDFREYDLNAAKKHLRPVAAEPLACLKESFLMLADWNPESLHEVIHATAEKLDVGMGKVGMPLRVAVCGTGNSPSINEVLALLGKEKSMARIDNALAYIERRAAQS